MTANELRALSGEDLRNKATELKATIFDMKMKLKTGRLDSTADLAKTKRDLARVNTLLREQEMGIRRETKA
ncbi:50S ribosomal protein L29 [Vulgatibacter sp.]|uniref:50S ribosomal protein L29 n=1 Tax=Vulgatibacter sp. TaxID=1971226 RepID=UPI003566A49D